MLPKKSPFLITALLFLLSCHTGDLYEKVESIPQQEWKSDYKPRFEFTVKDTAADYQLNIILRHNEKYGYRNVWLNLYAQAPGDTARKFTVELPLASGQNGWLGSGMDDLYEHRIALTLDPSKFNFRKPGDYSFTLEHIMREDPLQNVLNVGLSIEKKP